jgi:hypothetical protein
VALRAAAVEGGSDGAATEFWRHHPHTALLEQLAWTSVVVTVVGCTVTGWVAFGIAAPRFYVAEIAAWWPRRRRRWSGGRAGEQIKSTASQGTC